MLPPWYFANYPKNNILFATHNGDFAQRWGRRVRGEITNESDVLGISHVADQRGGGSIRAQ